MAISAATRVAALKKVDFPVFGLPITPNNREYDLCIYWFTLCLLFQCIGLYYLRFQRIVLDGVLLFSDSMFN